MPEPATLAVGWAGSSGRSRLVELPLSTLYRHAWITGSTGWGKSGYILSILLGVLTRHPHVRVVLVDLKGETAEMLRDVFLPTLAQRLPQGSPERLVSVVPFSSYVVPLNLLAPLPGVPVEVLANLACNIVAALVNDALGPRMQSLLSWLSRAVILAGGSLRDIAEVLADERRAHALALRVRDGEVRHYLREVFPLEPDASKQALRARLDWILLVPNMRAMLCAPTCLPGAELLEAGVTIVDLGGAPQGFSPLATFLGTHVMSLLTAAVFARRVTAETPPVLLVVDEWQSLVRTAASDFERLLAQARSKRVGLWLVNQTAGQVDQVSHELAGSLVSNIALQVAFRPDPSDLKHVMSLLPLTGRRVDPDHADLLLTPSEEKAWLLGALSRLPPRHALLVDRVAGNAQVIRTLSVPFEEATRRAAELPEELRHRYLRGRHGVPLGELLASTRGQDVEIGTRPPSEEPAPRARRAPTRPKLELPP